MNRDRWNWDSTRALYFGRPFVSIVLYEIVFLYSPGEDSLHSTLLKYCTSCQVVPSIVFHVRPLRNESATLTHSFTPSSFGRMQLTLFIQLQSIEVGLQGFTQHYKYRWYLVRKCRQWLEFSAGTPPSCNRFHNVDCPSVFLFTLHIRPSVITLKINSTAQKHHL